MNSINRIYISTNSATEDAEIIRLEKNQRHRELPKEGFKKNLHGIIKL